MVISYHKCRDFTGIGLELVEKSRLAILKFFELLLQSKFFILRTK